jgi:hypothetical protein
MRKLWLHAVVWSSETPLGGGAPGAGEGRRISPEEERGLGRERDREVEGGVDIGGRADPGSIRGDVSYVNEPPENIMGRVGGGGGPVSLTEGGDTSVGPSSEGGSDTGGPGGEQADAASNTGGVGGYLENEGQG